MEVLQLGGPTRRGAPRRGGLSWEEEISASSGEGEPLPSVGGCGAGVVANPGLVSPHWARSPPAHENTRTTLNQNHSGEHVNREQCLLLNTGPAEAQDPALSGRKGLCERFVPRAERLWVRSPKSAV